MSYSAIFTQLDIGYCSKCRTFYVLTVSVRKPGLDDNGREIEIVTPVVEKLVITPRDYKNLKSLDYSSTELAELFKEDSWFSKLLKMFNINT